MKVCGCGVLILRDDCGVVVGAVAIQASHSCRCCAPLARQKCVRWIVGVCLSIKTTTTLRARSTTTLPTPTTITLATNFKLKNNPVSCVCDMCDVCLTCVCAFFYCRRTILQTYYEQLLFHRIGCRHRSQISQQTQRTTRYNKAVLLTIVLFSCVYTNNPLCIRCDRFVHEPHCQQTVVLSLWRENHSRTTKHRHAPSGRGMDTCSHCFSLSTYTLTMHVCVCVVGDYYSR